MSGVFHPLVNSLLGKKLAAWTVMSRAENRNGHAHWNCVCDCGTERVVMGCHLTSGNSKGCGCTRPKGKSHSLYKHGASNTQLYMLWMGMNARCSPSNPNAKNYAQRGIAVCKRWRDSFEAFKSDMGPRPSPQHSIDRIDNAKGYLPGNCRWATQKEQMRNMRRNRLVVFRGKEMTLVEAVELSGINYATAKWRINNGWTVDGVRI